MNCQCGLKLTYLNLCCLPERLIPVRQWYQTLSATFFIAEFFSAVCSDDEDEEFYEVEDSFTPKLDHHHHNTGANNNLVSAERLSNKIKALQVLHNPPFQLILWTLIRH